jgi:hypothetical protein
VPDVEIRAFLHRRLSLFHATDIGVPRTLPQHARQIRKLLDTSNRVNFDVAVIQVSDVSTDTDSIRGVLREVAKSDPLDVAAHDVSPGYFRLVQCGFKSG